MYLLYSLVAAVSLLAHVVAITACNGTGFDTAYTVTVFTTITPTSTNFCLGPTFTSFLSTLNSTQIGTTTSLNGSSPTTSSLEFVVGPLLDPLLDPLLAYESAIAGLTNLTVCENATGNRGFNTTVCQHTTSTAATATATVLSNTMAGANNSSTLPTTQPSTTLGSQPSDNAATTSTKVIVVSLSTDSDGRILTATITSASTGASTETSMGSLTTSTNTTKASTTTVTTRINTVTAVSAACARRLPPRPLRALFRLNWTASKARAQALLLRGFGDWVRAEKAKAFLGTEDTTPNTLTTVTIEATPLTVPTATAVAALIVAVLSATSLVCLAVLISLLCRLL